MCIIGNEKPQLRDIDNYVVIRFATNWKQLGKNLNINEDLLNIIEKNDPDIENCCSKMLSDWLDLTPHASWEILLDAADKIQSTVRDTVENPADYLQFTVEKLSSTADKLESTAENLSDVVEKVYTAADKFPKTIEKLDTAVEKLPNTVEKVNTAADHLPNTVEKLDTIADELPRTVGKLSSAVEKLPKAVDQLCETIDKLPKGIGKVHSTENTDVDNFGGM